MSTYRERREAKAERYREWAEKREQKADALRQRNQPAYDALAISQPMDGRTSKRINRQLDNERQNVAMAQTFRAKADSIEAAANHAIYSDDEDAVEQLQQRIADLEAQRDRIKAYNASCRKGCADTSLLTEPERIDLLRHLKAWGEGQCPGGRFPAYVTTNLAANIRRNRQRLETLEHGS